MDTAHTPTLLQLLSNPTLSLTDIARTLNLDTPVLINQLNDPARGIPPLLAAERARTQLLAAQHLATTLQTITAATNHVTSLIHSILPASRTTDPSSSHCDSASSLHREAVEVNRRGLPRSGIPGSVPITASTRSHDAPASDHVLPDAWCPMPGASVSPQHSVLLLRSTDVLRRCAMLFERIANPRMLRERAGTSPTASSSNSSALSPQHPFSFSATPGPHRPRDYVKPMHPGAHPYNPPHYTRLYDNSSYYWCTDTREWQLWDTAKQGPITASPFSLSFRSETHYHWDSFSNRWWIHTPFKCTPAQPPPEFPVYGDSDFNLDDPTTPRPRRFHPINPEPPKPVSFLTETTLPRATDPSSGQCESASAACQPQGLKVSSQESSRHPNTADSPGHTTENAPHLGEVHSGSDNHPCHHSEADHPDTSTPHSSADDPLPHDDDFVGSILNEFYLKRRAQGNHSLPWDTRPQTIRRTQSPLPQSTLPHSAPSSASPDARCPLPDASPPDRSPPY